jgi:hypothetical protein
MATMEVSIPVEVVEAEIKNVYGLDYPVELLDITLDESTGDVVMLVFVDDDEFSEISMFGAVSNTDLTDTWTVTTTADFIQGIL